MQKQSKRYILPLIHSCWCLKPPWCQRLHKVHQYITHFFHFYGCSPNTDISLGRFGKCFKRLKFLKEISLKLLSFDELKDLEIQNLAKFLQKCLVKEDFPWFSRLFPSNRYMTFSHISRCLERLKLLKERILDSYNSSKGYRKCFFLQKLHLDFGMCSKVTNLGLCHISKSLKRLASLKSANFYFYACNGISDIGFQGLSAG